MLFCVSLAINKKKISSWFFFKKNAEFVRRIENYDKVTDFVRTEMRLKVSTNDWLNYSTFVTTKENYKVIIVGMETTIFTLPLFMPYVDIDYVFWRLIQTDR